MTEQAANDAIRVSQNVKAVTIAAVVIRADGTREDLGVVSYWHRNPLRRLSHAVSQFLRRVRGNSSH